MKNTRIDELQKKLRRITADRNYLLEELESAGSEGRRVIQDDLERLGMESDDITWEITRIKSSN
jgi:hypothetical protein